MKTSVLVSILFLSVISPAFSDAISIPPGEATAKEALNKSPRHGEWVDAPVTGMKGQLRSASWFTRK